MKRLFSMMFVVTILIVSFSASALAEQDYDFHPENLVPVCHVNGGNPPIQFFFAKMYFGKIIWIDESALDDHLAHGDRTGNGVCAGYNDWDLWDQLGLKYFGLTFREWANLLGAKTPNANCSYLAN